MLSSHASIDGGEVNLQRVGYVLALTNPRVINAMLSKDYGQKLTEVTNYPSTSAEVAALFSTADKRKLGFDIVDRGVKLYGLDFPANIDKWVESWNTIKTA